jgi:hypothetical protein
MNAQPFNETHFFNSTSLLRFIVLFVLQHSILFLHGMTQKRREIREFMVSPSRGLMFSYILSLLHDFGGVHENYAWHLQHPASFHYTLSLEEEDVFPLLPSCFLLFCVFSDIHSPLHEV